jgi:hypothetical protein
VSEHESEQPEVQPEETGGESESQGGQEGTPSPSSGWGGPSQEEWQQTQQMIQQMAQYFQPEEEEEPDFGSYDDPMLAMQAYVDSRFQQVAPYVQGAARQQGEQKLNELFEQHEKQYGKFDRQLAEYAATALVQQTGDPVKAVEEGVKYAAQVAERERKAAVEEYKKKIGGVRRDFDDLPVEGGGDGAVPKAKSYDEVIERWASQMDV